MGSTEAAKDDLIAIQQELFLRLKRSHQLFVRNFYFSALAFLCLLAPAMVFFLIYAVNSGEMLAYQPFLFTLTSSIFPIVLWIRAMKETIGFVRWSGPFIHNMESSGEIARNFVGLTTYMTRLFRAAFADTTRARDPRDISSTELLAELRRRESLKRILLGFTLVLLGVFMLSLLAWGFADPSIWVFKLIPSTMLVIIIVVFVLVGIMFRRQGKWAKTVENWVHIYDALEQWGEDLERSFLYPPGFDEGGG